MSTIEALIRKSSRKRRRPAASSSACRDRLAWKPHDKSIVARPAGAARGHGDRRGRRDLQMSPFKLPKFTQDRECRRIRAGAREECGSGRRSAARDRRGGAREDVASVDGGREVMALPVGAVLRTIMLNHWYHHRGQLSVYFRQVEAPVPSIYGPSADENPFKPQPAESASA